MRPIEELVNTAESGWTLVREWISTAKNNVEILPFDTARAKEALYQTQVTTRSPMGAVIYTTGGILVDHGWIRILGSGHKKLDRTLPAWNKGKSFSAYGERPTFLLVADDAAGGFFAVNGGKFGEDMGKIYYLEPESLKWESLGITYSEFLEFCFNGDLEKFYQELRWLTWKEDITQLDGSTVFNFFPYLWTAEGKDINKNSRKAVPVGEQYEFNRSSRRQLGLE